MTAQTAEPTPEVGQIWREVDPRQERHVFVEQTGLYSIFIHRVEKTDGRWQRADRASTRQAMRERFNGKRGGYTFVEAAS